MFSECGKGMKGAAWDWRGDGRGWGGVGGPLEGGLSMGGVQHRCRLLPPSLPPRGPSPVAVSCRGAPLRLWFLAVALTGSSWRRTSRSSPRAGF